MATKQLYDELGIAIYFTPGQDEVEMTRHRGATGRVGGPSSAIPPSARIAR